ncbi:MAG: polysulfide reductase NrfD [Bacteroidetes bacterium]|jgi:Ni/Fe-hydrogenase subunit HybB-like protein|nr:polysulfide reductase NrfD [Bacteroidota bacterium]MBT5530499.1 polysulfide reductase NrfD [Cytophagia bacterium]MBT3424958.1 polysulfide reductase NrfD [Bacteroidota bacterium]MBT3800159.1 polysulfide reductase NrfD [Bacteroidota bacterium]MBT3934114.1 polysulfide reductase NrfD [Bacteroidota bacterium]
MDHVAHLYEALSKVDGFIYPNEIELSWSILIVLYPYITGLVAGAFILASLNRVFNVKALKPTYHLSLLTALAFLLIATMPLINHLGHPGRFYELMITPNPTSAMAIFGFVYVWYLMVVLLLEIWFDYRKDLVIWSNEKKGIMKWVYKILTLGVMDISPKALKWDEKLGYIITVIGIPSAFLLHGYVGFIFGSVKANPWWSSVMMPVIFLFSAMVSGIALVMFVYMVVNYLRKQKIDMLCLDTIAKYLFYVIILDFTLEALDQIHRIYEAEESFEIISLLVSGKLNFTLIIMQVFIGMIIPLLALGFMQFYKPKENVRKFIYFIISLLVLIGIFFMRWNVVIGGQLFSKSFYGFTHFKLQLIGSEGFLMGLVWLIVPFLILAGLLWLLPPWKKSHTEESSN